MKDPEQKDDGGHAELKIDFPIEQLIAIGDMEIGLFNHEHNPEDEEELAEINSKTPEQIIAAARVSMDQPCIECKGLKRMDYLLLGPAPWYMRIFGGKQIQKWQKDVPCKRCKGTGKEFVAKPLPEDLPKPGEIRKFETLE